MAEKKEKSLKKDEKTKSSAKKGSIVKKETKKDTKKEIKRETKKESKGESKKETGKEKSTQFGPEKDKPKKLYRSRKHKVFAGVCGGIGEYFNIDPNIVRFLWVVSCFAGGVGVIGYIIALIMIPEVPADVESEIKVRTKSSREIGILIGVVLIFLGVFFLIDRTMFFGFPYRFWGFRYLDYELIFPLFVIIAGVLYILYIHRKGHVEEKGKEGEGGIEHKWKFFKRSVTDKKIAGICGGIAEHFEIDPTIIRLLYILMTLFSGIWIGVIIYIILAIIMPQEEIQAGGTQK